MTKQYILPQKLSGIKYKSKQLIKDKKQAYKMKILSDVTVEELGSRIDISILD